MLLLLPPLCLFITALILIVLRWRVPRFRFGWLIAVGGTCLAWLSLFLWQGRMPITLSLPAWQPQALLSEAPLFVADGLGWLYAFTLVTLALAILLTATVREPFPADLAWAGMLALGGLGLLAVTAGNPLTLVLIWAALDWVELGLMLRSVRQPASAERAVAAFWARATGLVVLLLANVVSVAAGANMNFMTTPPQAGLLLVLAAGLRLGVLPLHLPYTSETSLRRGLGTMLRLVAVASSLILLVRIPPSGLASPFTPFLKILVAMAALYGGWMWLRAPDELAGRPFWLIGLGALASAAALRGNSLGAAAWGVALILGGGTLFLASVQHPWLNRLMLVGAWALSSLPFSLSAAAWGSKAVGLDLTQPLFLVAQALLMAGFIRRAWKPSPRASLESQPVWARNIYPAGIATLLLIQFGLGFWGWEGARQRGELTAGLTVSLLTLGLVWATPRFPLLNPPRAHWVQPPRASRLERVYRNMWAFYHGVARLGRGVSDVLEGEGGLMWALLFLVLLVSLLTQRTPR